MARRIVAAGVLHGRSVRLICQPCELSGQNLLMPAEGALLAEIHDRLHHGPLGCTAEIHPAETGESALLAGAEVLA